MVVTNKRRLAAATAAVMALGLAASACGSGTEKASGTSPGKGKPECAQLTKYGDLTGKSVHVYTTIVAPEDASQKASYKLFTQCTGAKVQYEGSREMEAQILVRAKSGNLPDIAYVPQPGLLQNLVKQTDTVVEPPKQVADNVDKFWGSDWKQYGTVDGKFYAAPLGANVKSFVWYSPKMFEKNGWKVPTTWEDMIKLSDQIAAKGIKPWCIGLESGEATGWPATDWIEDAVLRTGGPQVYDDWISHKIPFNDPKIAQAVDMAGSIMKNPKYVNGGIGDVKSEATKAWGEAGLPILKGQCAMYHMASFYSASWPKGTKVGPDGDAYAFYMPTKAGSTQKPVEVAGEFVAAFNKDLATQAFQTYLSTDVWANEKAKATPQGGWVSANKGLDPKNLANPIDQLSAKTLQDPKAVARFDASDAMPADVGTNSFWKEMVDWITGASTKDVLDKIEKSWPKD